jgi:glucokinase
MRIGAKGKTKKNALRRLICGAGLVALLVLFSACQTPPKKSNKSAAMNRHATAQAEGTSARNSLDLFSSSAELFGTDPRVSRPALVATTAFAAVGGAALLVCGAVVVSAARAGRTGRPRRSRSQTR